MHAQLTEDGLSMEIGVNAPNHVAVECNQEGDLVLSPVLLMVEWSVLVMTLKRNFVIWTLHAQLMDNGATLVIGPNVQNLVGMERNQE
jgi:hypothetical protein